MTEHHLTDEYVERLSRWAVSFPTAHTFLRRLQDEGTDHSLWLSTAVNAHLYIDDNFLAYLKLKNPELEPPALIISPKFNQQIAAHTTDGSARLFPKPFDQIVMSQRGFATKWAVRHAQGNTELTVATPTEFFDAVFAALIRLQQ